MLVVGEARSFSELAREENITDAYIRRIMPLAYLSPKIIEAILNGSHPPHWTIDTLCDVVSQDWSSQRTTLRL